MKAESFHLFQGHFGTFDVIQKLYAKTAEAIYATKTDGNSTFRNER
jgi:hypothetical protein